MSIVNRHRYYRIKRQPLAKTLTYGELATRVTNGKYGEVATWFCREKFLGMLVGQGLPSWQGTCWQVDSMGSEQR